MEKKIRLLKEAGAPPQTNRKKRVRRAARGGAAETKKRRSEGSERDRGRGGEEFSSLDAPSDQ